MKKKGISTKVQALRCDNQLLTLCHSAALDAWEGIREVGKKTELFRKVI